MLQTLINALPLKGQRHQAKLRGVDGYTGQGGVTVAISQNGKRKMGVALRGIAGRSAEVFADGAYAGTVELTNGRADQTFDTTRGETLPEIHCGTEFDIRQNGQIILKGALTSD